MMPLINQLLCTAPSQFHLHVLHGGIAGCPRHPGNVMHWRICYLCFCHGAVYFECISTCLFLFFFPPVESTSTSSSISSFPPGLQDICSLPSQVILHPKPWSFLPSLTPPNSLLLRILQFSLLRVSFCIHLVHPMHLLLPPILPFTHFLSKSHSILTFNSAVGVSPSLYCSFCMCFYCSLCILLFPDPISVLALPQA